MKRKTIGILNGAIGSICYGTNPVFALHLYSKGLDSNSVLFYRYSFAVIFWGLWVAFVKKISLKISKHEIIPIIFASFCFAMSSETLFASYNFIDGGIASVILFVYPIFVALIMAFGFKEKLKKSVILSIVLVLIGIVLFYKGKNGHNLNLTGVALVIISALSYAIYMVCIKTNQILKKINTSKLTFYVMLFGIPVFAFNLHFLLDLKPISYPLLWFDILMLAILPTVCAIETLTISIKLIGPTISSVISALEPVSAMIFCVLIYKEQITLKILLGIFAILFAVFIIIFDKKKINK
jgi:drug/metabolite transporter (DMT)-like permease